MSLKPLVSVIMPCYNTETYLREAIESLLGQRFKDFELIIINDGSTDDTSGILHDFQDSRVRIFSFDENEGNYAARNKGLMEARGMYVAMADADDISLPERLQVQFEYLENHSEVSCVGAMCEVINAKGETIGKINRPLEYEEIKIALLKDNYIPQPALMFRMDLVGKGYTYDESYIYAGDYDFVQRISRKHPITNIDQILVKYRVHPSQISSAKRKEQVYFANRVRIRQIEELGMRYTVEELSLHFRLIFGAYFEDEELVLAENWLNRLLEQNIKKSLYHDQYFHVFCQKLAESAVRKNALGGWAIEKELLEFTKKMLSPGKTILEFGSGTGTEALLKRFAVISLEHDPEFLLKRAPHHDCRHAPIVNGWYKREVVREALDEAICDLILIDGPLGDLRKGILDHIDIFSHIKCPIIFDDMDRKEDHDTMKSFCKILDRHCRIFKGNKKSFALCTLEQS